MWAILVLVMLSTSWLVEAGEFCSMSFVYCPYYCCNYGYCCSDCRLSIRSHPECYSYSSVAGIIGGVISAIFFIIVVSIIVSICCGCICSQRTGIQRRGRVIRSGDASVTVIQQPAGAAPPYGFVSNPGIYPQGQVVYPQAQPGINQTSYPYPPVKTGGYQQSSAPPIYTVEQGYPPPYNPGFTSDHR